MRLEPQIDQLYQTLDRELDNFPSGAKFYSVRQLLTKFNCHRGVLDEVLERLEEENLINRVPQVGIFSNITRKPNARKVLWVVPDWPSELLMEWGMLASRYTDAHPGWHLSKTMLVLDRDTIRSIKTDGFDAVIIFMPSSNITSDDMLYLATLAIPVVLLNADTGSFEVSNVKSADSDGAILACKYLYENGHRRIAVVQSEPPSLPVVSRVKTFLSISGLMGMKTILIDCHTSDGEFSPHKAYLGMKRLIEERGKVDFSAVYTVSGESVPGIMTALREAGCELPDDVSIMSHSSEQVGQFYHPALTAVCADLKAEVAAAFEGIAAVLEKRSVFFKADVPMRIIERASVKNVCSAAKK